MDDDCVPAVLKHAYRGRSKGDYCSKQRGKNQAREELWKRDGLSWFPGAVCRHLCENDSEAPNGFVCLKHTVWGTVTENNRDQGHKHSCYIERVCPHCGLSMRGPGYFQHIKNCG